MDSFPKLPMLLPINSMRNDGHFRSYLVTPSLGSSRTTQSTESIRKFLLGTLKLSNGGAGHENIFWCTNIALCLMEAR